MSNAAGSSSQSSAGQRAQNASGPAGIQQSGSSNRPANASGSQPLPKPNAFEAVDSLFENALSQFSVPAADSKPKAQVPAGQNLASSSAATTSSAANAEHNSDERSFSDSSPPDQKQPVSQKELRLNSRRPAPDWDDEHNHELAALASPIVNAGLPHQPETSNSGNVSNSENDAKPDVSRPFEELPFEDLDPASFVLDRPEKAAVDKPTGYFDWIADSPQSVWYVRHRNGAQYGPAIGKQMRAWVDEGRVTDGCHVWREGWAHWRTASDVFPQIRNQNQMASTPAVTVSSQAGKNAPRSPIQPLPDQEPEVAGNRSSNQWLFPALLFFLAVVATIIGVAVYQFLNQDNVDQPSKREAGEVVDPFAPAE